MNWLAVMTERMKYNTLSVPAELLAAFKQAFPVLTLSKFVGRVIQLCLDCPDFVQFLQSCTVEDVKACCYVART